MHSKNKLHSRKHNRRSWIAAWLRTMRIRLMLFLENKSKLKLWRGFQNESPNTRFAVALSR
jgi:hypothetical protein